MGEVETVIVEAWVPGLERVTLDGLAEAVGPRGDTVAVRVTVPVNPPALVRVRVDVAEEPGGIERYCGVVDRVRPLSLKLCTNVDHAPRYSPATQSIVGSVGSRAAPK